MAQTNLHYGAYSLHQGAQITDKFYENSYSYKDETIANFFIGVFLQLKDICHEQMIGMQNSLKIYAGQAFSEIYSEISSIYTNTLAAIFPRNSKMSLPT